MFHFRLVTTSSLLVTNFSYNPELCVHTSGIGPAVRSDNSDRFSSHTELRLLMVNADVQRILQDLDLESCKISQLCYCVIFITSFNRIYRGRRTNIVMRLAGEIISICISTGHLRLLFYRESGTSCKNAGGFVVV